MFAPGSAPQLSQLSGSLVEVALAGWCARQADGSAGSVAQELDMRQVLSRFEPREVIAAA